MGYRSRIFLTTEQVCRKFKVSRKGLYDRRHEDGLAHTFNDKGEIVYPRSEIAQLFVRRESQAEVAK